jgi:DNA-binding CsgD family transcriptional regulator
MNILECPPWPLIGRDVELAIFRETLGDRHRQMLLIHGPAGSGKSRLAEECYKLAVDKGHRCIRAAASRAAQAIPLGALGHLLPAGVDAGDPVALFTQAARWLGTEDDRIVLLVDDLHLLDTTSVTLLGQLMDDGRTFLIGTVRSDVPLSDVVDGFERGDRGRRLDLAAFDVGQVQDLLSQVLGGIVEHGTVFRLHRASGGEPLFLRELVCAALAAGTLTGDGGIWRLIGEPVSTRKLLDVIDGRVRQVPPSDRGVLAAIAACSPTGVLGLDQGALARLERAGLVQIRAEERRTTVAMAHPLYGQLVRSGMSLLDWRRLLIEHARRLEATGMRRREDRLRLATWVLEATGSADPQLLRQAAVLARHSGDFGAVADLTRALMRLDGTAGPRMMLGEALYELGRFDQAEDALRDAGQAAADDHEYLLVTLLRTQSLAWAALRTEEARQVNAAARLRLADPAARDALTVDRASLLGASGEPRAAVDLLRDLDHMSDARTRVMGALPKAWALAQCGRTAEAIAVAERAHRDQLAMPATASMAHACLHTGPQTLALVVAGRITDAMRLGQRGHDEAVREESLIAQMWLTVCLGSVEYWAGHMTRAHAWFATAAAMSADRHFRSCQWHALTGLALTSAAMGDTAAVDAAWRQAEQLAPPGYRRADASAVLGWRLAAYGQLRGARDLLWQGARRARATGSSVLEARLLSDIARLGDPRRVSARLAQLAAASDGALIRALAEHAAALVTRDPRRLEWVVGRFEAMGADLIAAETCLRAAEQYRVSGDGPAAARATARARRLAAACQGAHTPGLALDGTDEPLTAREHEIALLAATSMTSREIADQLVISLRTVDNHLGHIYRKTGITRRKDLHHVVQIPRDLVEGRRTA